MLTIDQRISMANRLEQRAFAHSRKGNSKRALRAWRAADRLIFNRLLGRA